jgi:D-alanine-D-alanine ligase
MAVIDVGLIFGGRSVEHDISVITAFQVIRAMDRKKYNPVPIYIARNGEWFTGDDLLDFRVYGLMARKPQTKIGVPAIISPDTTHRGLILRPLSGLFRLNMTRSLDVVMPLVHGTHGEDGTLQGLLELNNIPFVGCGVLASSVAMNKVATKAVLGFHNLPSVPYVSISRRAWRTNPEDFISKVEQGLEYPVVVKPVNLGSSIGVGKAGNVDELSEAIEVVAQIDQEILVEKAIEDAMDVNCGVLGNDNPIASMCEQPVSWEEFLTFEEKYMHGNTAGGMKGAQRIIPAPLSEDLTRQIQDLAVRSFTALKCQGIARVDFLVNEERGEVFVNELNTIPGSLSFYLWDPSGIAARELVSKLIELAIEAYEDKQQTQFTYQSDVLKYAMDAGLKGMKK